MCIHIYVRMKCGNMHTFNMCFVRCYHLQWVIWLLLILYEGCVCVCGGVSYTYSRSRTQTE